MKKRKNNVIPVAVLILCSLAFLILSYLSYQKIEEYASAAVSRELPVIVLDAGHGGEDGGAAGVSAVLEKDINLAVAQKLQKMLEASGFTVIMVRDGDVSVGDMSLDTVKQRKISDIHKRLEIAKANPGCVFISIHQNFFTSSKYSGAQMFYSRNNPRSKELAESIRGRVVELLQPENKRECKPAESSIYLLWNLEDPAVLVECGFLSNEEEAAKLVQPEYQDKVAFAIFCGFLDYYKADLG